VLKRLAGYEVLILDDPGYVQQTNPPAAEQVDEPRDEGE
jgi:hypothetical protein